MKYDIFISYRREGGYDTAKHLNDLLVRDGYNVSFDIDTLRNGDFDTQLLSRIDQCKDFVLIVDKHAFDRTIDPNFDPKKDWLRCELAYALKKKKNIIPVFLSGINGFPDNLPRDIIEVTKKNGPEYNRYYFNDFYRVLKKRFLHNRRLNVKKSILITLLFFLLGFVFCFNIFEDSLHTGQDKISYDSTEVIPSERSLHDRNKIIENTRDDILTLYKGSFSIVAPGAMKDGITWVYILELDPVKSECTWIEDDFVNITDSKGFCGTPMQGAEAWEVYNFNLHNSLRYAILQMRRVDAFYEGENKICKIRLELDSYNNLKMSFIEGTDAPAPLIDEQGNYTNVATFYRE
ncbi:MAG: toll/interleukin-1 receptor domain-containing protein [Bacteroidales bacterium]|nr:toll/interleukin-1 receptor domain-containing protein [Bacteroidales bacterium]